ncbi:PLD nuclease N-terminal domain-containing protein [Cellulomonas sp. KRMCY2]|uniref:PLD nuclease N-terminal domain-containing protein n=1 Tax=Cellulomonas sp. KRMCY2 TaxID=1304865 RepID=UPI00045E8920|nr:PLD nuclease N-terminal domain-containing protein [Cellulomonas sp. KRMCY2]
MLRYYLPYLIELALLVFALIDCIQTDSAAVRNLSKTVWVLLVILVPIVGPVAWLVAGRPAAGQRRRSVPWPSTQTAGFPEYERPRPARGPDDDPHFLAELNAPDPEQQAILRAWEAQLREREERLRAGQDEPGAEPVADPDRG